MLVIRQLCVNHLLLPAEILDLIKSYIFNDIVSHTAKIRKKTIHTLIQCSLWTGQYRKSREKNFLFWIEEDRTCPQYQCQFCLICGNYKIYESQSYNKVNCIC